MIRTVVVALLMFGVGLGIGLGTDDILDRLGNEESDLLIPAIIAPFQKEQEPPLMVYTIPRLSLFPRASEKIIITEELESTANSISYAFVWQTLGKKMTGNIILPRPFDATSPKAIILLRGYVPEEQYETGTGTKNAATQFAEAGYVTIAPDFFGYGDSDPEPTDTWQARFEKPLIVMELIDSLKTQGIVAEGEDPIKISTVGMWAHSNGGQIALTTLEAFQLDIPTTLWAPVSAPFPYSIQFFSDELDDEGKAQRKWISLFEEEYDVFDFSVTKHLDLLNAPLQLHHGEIDDAAPIAWSDEFVEKLEAAHAATDEAEIVEDYPITYYRYPNTDHNMQPSWNTAITRDIQFFSEYLQ
ncbi:MAG: hypothetical protein H6773_01930 [Pseudomonadales bacterium]|nr:hypothetical protein [Candidatus Woesebacteria bacterium]MCB9800916.1 hypothetical protein [Pseudomonadales bacterium]